MRFSVDGKTYEYDANSADNVELMAIERVTGMTTAELGDALQRGSLLAVTALIWSIRRRSEPDLEFNDVHFLPVNLRLEADEAGKDEVPSQTT